MKNIFRHIFTLTILVFFSTGCHAYYPDISGTVVDAETRQPIEGAVVLVEWTKKVGIGDYHTESVKVVEVVTDKEGKFKVTGILKPLIDPPKMTIYKKGYVAWSNRTIFPYMKERKDFKWQSGNIYKLEHFKAEYSYDKHDDFISTSITSSLNLEAKKKIYKAFEWEGNLAFQERMEKKKKQ